MCLQAPWSACERSTIFRPLQDAADLIEFASGPADSEWGSLRAKMGHPDPWPLNYFAIGNEVSHTPWTCCHLSTGANCVRYKSHTWSGRCVTHSTVLTVVQLGEYLCTLTKHSHLLENLQMPMAVHSPTCCTLPTCTAALFPLRLLVLQRTQHWQQDEGPPQLARLD